MTAAERPLVAIDGELVLGQAPAVHLSVRYAEAIERAGGMPLVLPPLAAPSFVEDLLDTVDGLLLSGGDDFHAEPLGLGATHPAAKPVPREKQDFDLALVRGALERGVPVLGICYGMQALALAEGAGLHQHLPDDRPDGREHADGVVHPVRVRPGTKLHELLGVASLDVISRHHQALSSAGPHWTVCGEDDEGSIEAVERSEHPFAVGVQWHPELAPHDAVQERLFAGLVRAARAHRDSRMRAPETAL